MRKIVLSILAILLLTPVVFFLQKYIPYRLHQSSIRKPRNARTFKQQNSSIRLNHLNELTQIPIFGQLFQQQKIKELVVLQKYVQAIQQSKLAIQTLVNQRSFSIWYHKAMSECLLHKLEDCEYSLRKASFYSNEYTQQHVQSIYQILQLYSKRQVDEPSQDLELPSTKNHIIDEDIVVNQIEQEQQKYDLAEF